MVNRMTGNVGSEFKDRVINLLSRHPEGLDILAIIKELDADVSEVKPVLVELQDKNQVSSGLKKSKGKFTSFDRYYFYHLS